MVKLADVPRCHCGELMLLIKSKDGVHIWECRNPKCLFYRKQVKK